MIENPNKKGIACSFLEDGFDLHNQTWFGLPNFIANNSNSTFTLKANFGYSYTCVGDTTIFTDSSSLTADSILWYFGDPGSGNADTSRFSHPQHVYRHDGNFNVTLIVRKGCQRDAIIKTVTICSGTIETCTDPSMVDNRKPGEPASIPIVIHVLENSKNVMNATTLKVNVKYNPELLRIVGKPQSKFGDIQQDSLNENSGFISFTIHFTRTLDTPSVEIAILNVQALLAMHSDGAVEITTSNLEYGGNTITSASCAKNFTIDESCIKTTQLKVRSEATISSIFPNPSGLKATIEIASRGNPSVKLEIYDVFGRLVEKVFDGELTSNKQAIALPTNAYTPGLYFCRLLSRERSMSLPVLIQK